MSIQRIIFYYNWPRRNFLKNFEISAKKLILKKKTNLNDFVDKNYISWAETPFKDILIKNSKIYVSQPIEKVRVFLLIPLRIIVFFLKFMFQNILKKIGF